MRFSNKRAFADMDAPSGPIPRAAVPPTTDTAMALARADRFRLPRKADYSRAMQEFALGPTVDVHYRPCEHERSHRASVSSRLLASFKSGVSKPSVNQP